MDFNRQEAIRAKCLAEKMMENRDFLSARKLVSTAQNLFPDLENISQMILVCDVLCLAENKVNSNLKNWYTLLKIEPTADEASIRKQYLKFALLLHPDKNKFPGASDAFTLICNAQKVLLDREKRMFYDHMLKVAGRFRVTTCTKQQASTQSNIERHPRYTNDLRNNGSSEVPNQQKEQQHHQFVNNKPTFWTVCPSCKVRYQYYKEVMQRMLVCQNCKNNFIADEIDNPGAKPETNHEPRFSKPKEPTSHDNGKVKSQVTEKSNTKDATERNAGGEKLSGMKTGLTGIGDEGSTADKESANLESTFRKPGHSGEPFTKNSTKRKTAESCGESGNSSDAEIEQIPEDGGNAVPKSCEVNSDLDCQSSSRPRKHVSSDVNNWQSPLKRPKSNGSFHVTAQEIDEHDTKVAEHFVGVAKHEKEVRKHDFPAEKDLQNGRKGAGKAYEKMGGHKEDEKTSSLPPKSPSTSTDREVVLYPDPEFTNFDDDRKEGSFAVGQVWALYDTLDAMPRFYARISKIDSPGFKLRITWLEPEPDDDAEIKWVEKGLPASCGKFRRGKTEYVEDHLMFSHLVYWEKGSRGGTYQIHPRKGEIWALFKDWDLNWDSNEARKKYAYEFVEVLSDYSDGLGIYVAFLAKVKGFACVFHWRTREARNINLVPPKAIFSFSHKVPSFQLTGKEREDVPQGSFELDPASLPTNNDGTFVAEDFRVQTGEMHTYESSSKSMRNMEEPKAKSDGSATRVRKADTEAKAKFDGNTSLAGSVGTKAKSKGSESAYGVMEHKTKPAKTSSMTDMKEPGPGSVESASRTDMMRPNTRSRGNLAPRKADKESHPESDSCGSDNSTDDCVVIQASADEFFEVPAPEFYNFDLDRSPDKFQNGQIWAIYCDEDTLPKYYGLIKRIDHFPAFQLHITWLEPCPPPKETIGWLNREILICCGRFKLMKGKPQTYTNTNSFSHLLRSEQAEKNVYAIFPRKGEVWALYRDWNAGVLDDCKYDIVEVTEEKDFCVEVSVLELVVGYKSVFRPRMKRQSDATVQISQQELLRFSHQIPAFRLTKENGGRLQGFWELDTAALPKRF